LALVAAAVVVVVVVVVRLRLRLFGRVVAAVVIVAVVVAAVVAAIVVGGGGTASSSWSRGERALLYAGESTCAEAIVGVVVLLPAHRVGQGGVGQVDRAGAVGRPRG